MKGIILNEFILFVDSAMFLISGNAAFSLMGRNNAARSTHQTNYTPIEQGNLDSRKALSELLDCCIMYYYSVAHKYVVMVCLN